MVDRRESLFTYKESEIIRVGIKRTVEDSLEGRLLVEEKKKNGSE